jgi:hypothetical protein
MSSGQPAQTQQVSKVELPAWVNEASQSNYQMAKDVSGRPLEQYQGQRVAAPSDMTTQGYGLLKSGIGAENPLYDEAAGMYRSSTGPLDINKFLNPYTNEVEQRAIGNANTSLTQQLANNASSAVKAGGFGGSRFGVQQGVAQAQGVKNIGDLSAGIRKEGFDTAANLATADLNRRATAGSGLLATAGAKGASRISDISALLGAGQSETGSRQKVIDAEMGKFDEARNYPVEQLNMRLAALGMSPYGKTETGSKTSTAEVPATDWATLGLGAMKAAPGLIGSAAGGGSGLLGLLALSDRNTKTDITKLTDGEIPLYSYRYKDDPKTYPKVVGPMAQDIEKKYPKAIKKVGRHKAVDIGNLMEVLS